MLRGVYSVMPGYAGGAHPNPTYEQVSSGMSGHAEVTKIEYDPSLIAYDDLLTVFFATHDPTTLNRQGHDVGTQYRSVIFYYHEEERKASEKSKEDLAKSRKYNARIVTEIIPATTFYPAEEYHQKYWLKHPEYACHLPRRY